MHNLFSIFKTNFNNWNKTKRTFRVWILYNKILSRFLVKKYKYIFLNFWTHEKENVRCENFPFWKTRDYVRKKWASRRPSGRKTGARLLRVALKYSPRSWYPFKLSPTLLPYSPSLSRFTLEWTKTNDRSSLNPIQQSRSWCETPPNLRARHLN